MSESRPECDDVAIRSDSRDLRMGAPLTPMPLAFGLPGAPAGSWRDVDSGRLRTQLSQVSPLPKAGYFFRDSKGFDVFVEELEV